MKFYNNLNIELASMEVFKAQQFLKNMWMPYLLKEKEMSPMIFFLILALQLLGIQNRTESFWQGVSVISIYIYLKWKINFLYLVLTLIECSYSFTCLMFGICFILASDKPTKIILLLFMLGLRFTLQLQLQMYFITVFSALLAFQIYYKFIFKTLRENRVYFNGFFSISFVCLSEVIRQYLSLRLNYEVRIGIFLFAFFLAKRVIQFRLLQILKTQVCSFKNNDVLAIYMQLIKQKYSHQDKIFIFLAKHRALCTSLSCYCHKEFIHFSQFYNELYDYLYLTKQFDKELIIQQYLDNLLSNKSLLKSVYYFNQIKNKRSLSPYAILRMQLKIKESIELKNFDNNSLTEYQYGLEYDGHYIQLIIFINDIIKEKSSFFKEVGKQQPKLTNLQHQSQITLKKMKKLNEFYHKIIKNYEKVVKCFEATLTYSIFLLTTSNYIEQAESLLKQAKKMLEEPSINFNSSIESYSMRVSIKPKKDLISLNLTYDTSDDDEKSINSEIKLIIDMASNGVCQKLGYHKLELIGLELNKLIPQNYKQVHEIRLNELFQEKSMNFQATESKVLHNMLELPMRKKNGELLLAFIYIQILNDIEKGLTFISVVKLPQQRSKRALLNFKGEITEMEEGFNQFLAYHSEVSKYLQIIRKTWRQEHIIPEESLTIVINSINFNILINSPLLVLFTEKRNLITKTPPIHLTVKNESVINLPLKNDKKIDMINHLKNLNQANLQQNSTISESKKENYAINIIQNFESESRVAAFRPIFITFGVVLALILTSIVISYFLTLPNWNVTSTQNNPINDIKNIMLIKNDLLSALVFINDNEELKSRSQLLNLPKINKYFDQRVIDYLIYELEKIKNSLLTKVQQINVEASSILEGFLQNMLDQQLSIDPKNINHQQFSLFDILINYLVDLSLISQSGMNSKQSTSIDYPTLLISKLNSEILDALDAVTLQNILRDNFTTTMRVNTTIVSTLIVAIIISILLFSYFLRKRLVLHYQMYDMIISISTEQLQNQVQKLNQFSSILSRFKDENYTSKMIQYSHLLIDPKHFFQEKQKVKTKTQLLPHELTIHRQHKGKKTINVKSRNNSANVQYFQSIFSKIKEQVYKQNNVIIHRKGKQLVVQDSEYNKNTLLNKKHLAIYLQLILSLIFVGLFFLIFEKQVSLVDNHLTSVGAYLRESNQNGMNFVVSQSYLREGNANKYQINAMLQKLDLQSLNGENSQGILQTIENRILYFNKTHPTFTEIQDSCWKIQKEEGFRSKYCKYNYSIRILSGEFNQILNSLYEYRYIQEHAVFGSQNYTLAISQTLFYLSSLYAKLDYAIRQEIIVQENTLITHSSQLQNHNIFLLKAAILWWLAVAVICLMVLLKMRREYIQQIVALSILSNEMLVSNKRIYTFLVNLSKVEQ